MFLKKIVLILNFMCLAASEFDDVEKYFYNQEQEYRIISTPSAATSMTTQDKTLENVVVKVGQQAVLPCFINNLGSHKVIWVKDGDILALGATKINSDTRLNIQHRYLSEWHLVIDNVVTDDEGEYICKTNGNFFKVLNLQVLMPPTIDDALSTPAGSQNIKEGSGTTLKCFADAKPEPVIKWYKWKKYKNFQTEKEELDFTGNEIVIPSVKRNDANMYECIAKNSVPPATSRIFTLQIQFLPVVDLEIRKTFQFLHKKFSLECKIEANPIERLYWLKNGVIYDAQLNDNNQLSRHTERSISHDLSHVRVDKYDISNENEFYKVLFTLTVMNANKHDFGEYQCCAVNQYGQICSNILVQEIFPETTTNRLYTMNRVQSSKILPKLTTPSVNEIKKDNRLISSQEDDEGLSESEKLQNFLEKDKRRHFLVKSKQYLQSESTVGYNSAQSLVFKILNVLIGIFVCKFLL